MPKKWFGPVLCPSGCCYVPPPPPPPPPCACEIGDCLEPYANNYSSVRFEAELDDSYETFGVWKRLTCETTCRRVYDVRDYRRTITGLSAFSGTYDIPFYAYDPYLAAWVEADPSLVSCGVWFFPTITANVTITRTVRRFAEAQDVYSLYTDTGCTESTRTESYTFPVNLETRSGIMWTTDPMTSFVFAPDFYGTTFGPPYSGVAGIQQTPAVAQRVQTADVFACASSPGDPLAQTWNVDTRYHLHGSPLVGAPRVDMGSLGIQAPPSRAVGLKFIGASLADEPRRSSYYGWSVYPYGGPGIPVSSTQCALDLEEYEDQYNATSTLIDDPFGTNPLVQCNPLYPTFSRNAYIVGPYRPNVWQFSNTSWRQFFRASVNV